MKVSEMSADPRHAGKHINPETGIWPTCEWGFECMRGFVSNARFGSGRVIERTNRATTRRWRAAVNKQAAKRTLVDMPETPRNLAQGETEGIG